jgi:predicted RNA-binding protein
MCEANAYLIKDGSEKVIMECVDIVRGEDDSIYLENFFNEGLKKKAHFKEMNLIDHRIVLVED